VLGIRSQLGALGALGAGRERGWLLPLDGGRLLGPASVLTGSDKDEEYELEVAGHASELPLGDLHLSGLLAWGKLPESLGSEVSPWTTSRMRRPDAPEGVVVTCGGAEKTLPISAQRLTVEEGDWVIDPSVPLDDEWHGACVVSAADGAIIGILVRHDERSKVVRIPAKLLP